jgi:hypothetical protein
MKGKKTIFYFFFSFTFIALKDIIIFYYFHIVIGRSLRSPTQLLNRDEVILVQELDNDF